MLKYLVNSWGGAEVFSRGVQWSIPVIISLLLSVDDFANFILYLSIFYISSSVGTFGLDKFIIVKGFIKLNPLFIQILMISILFPVCMYALELHKLELNILLFLSIFGFCISRLNIAFLRLNNKRNQYLLYRLTYNITRLLLYICVAWGLSGAVEIFIIVDAALAIPHYLFYKFITSEIKYAPLQKLNLQHLRTQIVFGVSVITTVLSSLLSLHFARVFLSFQSDVIGTFQFVMSGTIGGCISFVFAALAIRGEVHVYSSRNTKELNERGLQLTRSMLIYALIGAPAVFTVYYIYNEFSDTHLSIVNVSLIFLVQLLHPLWFFFTYKLYFLKRENVISIIVTICTMLSLLWSSLAYPWLGYESFIYGNVISITMMLLLGKIYIAKYCD